MTIEDGKTRAEALKNEANVLFKEQHFDMSIAKYTEAIELDDSNHVLYANRSIAYLKTEAYTLAIADAEKCIMLKPEFPKGYYRRASCLMMMGKFQEAIDDFRNVLKILPDDKNAKSKIAECADIMRRVEFAKCISMDEIVPASPKEDADIDRQYTGPRMPAEGVTWKYIQDMIAVFNNDKMIHYKDALRIITDVMGILSSEPNIVYVDLEDSADYFTVLGDTHGQFHDTLNIFKSGGFPSANKPYIFNGDYVDRGSYSVENVLLLFALKILTPKYVHLNRGNHETKNLNSLYGFFGEVQAKFPASKARVVQDEFSAAFCSLPLGCIAQHKVIIVHGGLFAEDGVKLDDLQAINRFLEPTDSTPNIATNPATITSPLMNELLWSDPQPQPGRSPSVRGVGSFFGPDVTKRFLADNGLDYLIRSHQLKEEGFEVMHDGKCITIFSSPDYCLSNNKAAYITIARDLIPQFHQYIQQTKPKLPPLHYALPMLRMMAQMQ